MSSIVDLDDKLYTLRDRLRGHGCDPKLSGTADGVVGKAKCPAHDDRNPSLSFRINSDGTAVVLHCHAGCDPQSVVSALGMQWSDLFASDRPAVRKTPNRKRSLTVTKFPTSKDSTARKPKPSKVATKNAMLDVGTPFRDGVVVNVYDYQDEDGEPIYRVGRTNNKQFPVVTVDQTSPTGYVWGRTVEPVLYRLPAVLDVVSNGGTVYVVEGEKDADTLNNIDPDATGYVATTSPGGAGKWTDDYADVLVGAGDVVVVADDDKPGLEHAARVRDTLLDRGVSVRVVRAKTGKDATDHVGAGHELEDFVPVTLPGDPPTATSVHDLEPVVPRSLVDGLLPERGIALVWAQPSAGKSVLMLRAVSDLVLSDRPTHLWGVPSFTVNRGIRKCLWIATEEDGGAFRHRWDVVRRGQAYDDGEPMPVDGDVVHLWANDTDHPVTLDRLGPILDREPDVDLVVLDTLTGIRPTSVNGSTIKWDADNDAANVVGKELRRLAVLHDCTFVLVHHSDKGGKNYRGPTEWWAFADVMVGLRPVDGQRGAVVVQPQKNRNGRVPDSVTLSTWWTGSADDGTLRFGVEYDGAAPLTTIPGIPESVTKVYDVFRNRQRATQAEVIHETRLDRKTVKTALERLQRDKRIRPCREEPLRDRSPVYDLVDDD